MTGASVIRTAQEEELTQLQLILQHAPDALKSRAYLNTVYAKQNPVVGLLDDLHKHFEPEKLAPPTVVNTPACDAWCAFGRLLVLQGRIYQALEVFEALYLKMVDYQTHTRKRFHKGLPLFHMSLCYQRLGMLVHAKRYMMLALCEDAVTGKGVLDKHNTGTYGPLAGYYGLSDQEIQKYVVQAYKQYEACQASAAMPEWILQNLDQNWKTEIPSAQEAGMYHITQPYCRFLLSALGGGDGKGLERLAEYLVGAMPGCRTYRRARTPSTDYDIVASVEGPIVDFRSELGRYLVSECKDKKKKKVDFSEIAKFCRVLDSVKAKFGIVFSPKGHSGGGRTTDADREILKVYQDRGIVIVVIDRDDLQRVAAGANFISLLREKYEKVRLDLIEDRNKSGRASPSKSKKVKKSDKTSPSESKKAKGPAEGSPPTDPARDVGF